MHLYSGVSGMVKGEEGAQSLVMNNLFVDARESIKSIMTECFIIIDV